MTAMTSNIDTTIPVRAGQVWSFQDGSTHRRKFRITSIREKWGKLCVFGAYVASGTFIGASWTVTKLQRGYRGARLEEDAEDRAPEPPVEHAPVREHRAPKIRLCLPRGMSQAEAIREIERVRRRYVAKGLTPDAKGIAQELSFSESVVASLLARDGTKIAGRPGRTS